MSTLDRRDALKLIGLMAAAPTFSVSCSTERSGEPTPGAEPASTAPDPNSYTFQLFTDHELETVRVLVDWIIPADERSGSATDAGVPAFIDFILTDEKLDDRTEQQTAFRGGLAWIDYECLDRFNRPFVECTDKQQEALIEAIAWPEAAAPDMKPGVTFFNSLRNLTASGFFTSKMGMEDLKYRGNRYVAEWTGCPDEVHEHVGLST
jgi:hypothetical protein